MVRQHHPIRVAFAAVVLFAIAGCGATTIPSNSTAPGAATSAAASAGAPNTTSIVAGATVTSVADIAAAENALVDKVADAAGLPTFLGPDTWAWANKLLHDELAKAGRNLTLTGDAALTASLNAGPPQAAVDGGGGMGIAMAAAMIGTSMATSSNPSANLNGTVTSTETKTANGETTSATVSFNIAMSTSGSSVEGDVSIGLDLTVTDAATGAVKKTASFHSRGKIKLDFCPDANGKVHGHVTITLDGGTSGAGSASISVDADIEGNVDDNAYLNQIVVSGQSSQSSTPPGGGPARTLRSSAGFTSGIDRAGNMVGNITNGSSEVDGPNDLTQAEADAAVGQIGSAAGVGYWIMGDAAQKKWRGGACVEIRASEHSRDVRKNETVQFQAQVFHRIEGNELHKPIVNTFTGKRSVDPVDIPVPAPVTISYKAGPMVDDTGTITMTTTSNRGIGVLALTFRVKGGWIIDSTFSTAFASGQIKGQKCGDPTGEWIASGTYKPKQPPGTFKGDQKWTITINADGATGTFEYQTSAKGQFAGVPITVYLVGRASGTVTLAIDPVSGLAHMVLHEQLHTYYSTTTRGGHGTDMNAPLETRPLDWDVGGNC